MKAKYANHIKHPLFRYAIVQRVILVTRTKLLGGLDTLDLIRLRMKYEHLPVDGISVSVPHSDIIIGTREQANIVSTV